jgi:hypothetical protein
MFNIGDTVHLSSKDNVTPKNVTAEVLHIFCDDQGYQEVSLFDNEFNYELRYFSKYATFYVGESDTISVYQTIDKIVPGKKEKVLNTNSSTRGRWNLNITATGNHDNFNENDIENLALEFTNKLAKLGHKIHLSSLMVGHEHNIAPSIDIGAVEPIKKYESLQTRNPTHSTTNHWN